MKKTNFTTRIKRLHQKLNGSTIQYDLTEYEKILVDIKKLEVTFQKKTDSQLKTLSDKLHSEMQLKDNFSNSEVIQSYALIRETIKRTLSLNPFDVQILGGIAMSRGKIIEMQTGEGKTLTAVFPAYLFALFGKGVHILTFNDYLARRDAKWMGPVYQFLGITVGVVQEGMSTKQRQSAYSADITYLTAKEAGFDFLRDGRCYAKADQVHRPFYSAIIDEADSILIDEARVPLILAGATENDLSDAQRFAKIATNLKPNIDFEFDEYARNIHLTDAGVKQLEIILSCENLFATENIHLLTRINCALHAKYLLQRDVDYIVRNNTIELVDEFTGRVAAKRRWPDGLQAALEAKEDILSQKQGKILNSITLQHFLKLYPNICGMTATATSSYEEFQNFYKLDITVIPPNKPCIRIDAKDIIFATKKEKSKALIDEIIEVHQSKRPILIGTASVKESAELAEILKTKGFHCLVLNAKNDEYEARIIAEAGRLGAVTISTNMAGRGTDIRLGGSEIKEKEQVISLGGLYVIGTNKHESERIDRQLRGRAGRQGDPGSSRFFISLEDDIFVKYQLEKLLSNHGFASTTEGKMESKLLRREVNRIQRIVEGQNLEIKKTLYKYSSLVEKQRWVMFDRRMEFLNKRLALTFFKEKSPECFAEYQSAVKNGQLADICQKILCYSIDKYWSLYLMQIADIREGIHLHRIGGQDPYYEFQKIAIENFENILEKLEKETLTLFNDLEMSGDGLIESKLLTPSATWTYLINDDPFENLVGLLAIGNIGVSIGAGILGPIVALFALINKFKRKGRMI
jgi:preprotein translocase subunit SecA